MAMTNEEKIDAGNLCKKCGAPIVWVNMESGSVMPCDFKLLTVVTDAGTVVKGRISHFANCPNANEFRKRG